MRAQSRARRGRAQGGAGAGQSAGAAQPPGQPGWHRGRLPLFSGVIKQVWLVTVCLCPALTYTLRWGTSLSHLSLVTEFMELNGRGRQSINEGSQPSPGPPRSPAACSHWMASLVAHSNALMSEKKSWMEEPMYTIAQAKWLQPPTKPPLWRC